jgi:hypothetical protein
MRRWIEVRGQALCTWLAVMRVYHGQPWGWLEAAWVGIWWRYYCPRPAIDDWTARACFKSGNCGCNNADRFTSTLRQGHRQTLGE